ncbi:MAG: metal ABC transporter ATP-binding protein [Acholeplasmataceae bacterium]|jgi:zinc transport system ATP-binding protein|nr:metal ABC transporter ATP-binding protein [Acholeplasmataceae bacterium]
MINANNVNVSFEKIAVLKDISFKIEPGEFVHILGPNGSGKTTLIKTILNIVKPDSGSIDVSTDEIGYLPQLINSKKQFPTTVKEVIYSGFNEQYLFPKNEQLQLIKDWLSKMEISDLYNKQIGDISGGQRQRVMLIRAIISKPKLLILDEPTSALDPEFRKVFYNLINQLNQAGMTIINITHDIDLNSISCQHKVIFLDQKIKYLGSYCDYHSTYGDKDSHV